MNIIIWCWFNNYWRSKSLFSYFLWLLSVVYDALFLIAKWSRRSYCLDANCCSSYLPEIVWKNWGRLGSRWYCYCAPVEQLQHLQFWWEETTSPLDIKLVGGKEQLSRHVIYLNWRFLYVHSFHFPVASCEKSKVKCILIYII